MRLRSILALFAIVSPQVSAWSDHASLAWPLVRTLPALQAPILVAEPLADFVTAEAQGLEQVLSDTERWSINSVAHYPATPGHLRFSAAASGDKTMQFLQAIRVNPTLEFPLYRQKTVDDPADIESSLTWSDISFLSVGTSHVAVEYLPLRSGDRVSVAHVLAAASDEPDFGMDIGLYANNGTSFGREYGFGEQPFGNPNLEYGSQAPFHMGFYHLDWLTRAAQPDLLRTLPHWRIALYDRLARFAFETGHPYWGWRFMGWALHYIGDLTQPYHTVPLPGVSTLNALWLVVQGRTGEAVQLVSNRHGVLESYQYQRVQSAQEAGDWQGPLLSAIAGEPEDYAFSPDQVIGDLAAGSVDVAAKLDATLERYAPSMYVSDPEFEWTGSGYESEVVERVKADKGIDAVTALDAAVIEQLKRFSRFCRAWVERASSHHTEAGTSGAYETP